MIPSECSCCKTRHLKIPLRKQCNYLSLIYILLRSNQLEIISPGASYVLEIFVEVEPSELAKYLTESDMVELWNGDKVTQCWRRLESLYNRTID